MDEVEVEEIIQGENNHLISVNTMPICLTNKIRKVKQILENLLIFKGQIEPRPEPMDHLDIMLFSSQR